MQSTIAQLNSAVSLFGTDVVEIEQNATSLKASIDQIAAYVQTSALASYFSAYKSSTTANVTGNNAIVDVVFDTTLVNQGNNYDSTTGRFTAPVNGFYEFSAGVTFSNIQSANLRGSIRGSTETRAFAKTFNPFGGITSDGEYCAEINFKQVMSAGQTCRIVVNIDSGSQVVGVVGTAGQISETWFFGALLRQI